MTIETTTDAPGKAEASFFKKPMQQRDTTHPAYYTIPIGEENVKNLNGNNGDATATVWFTEYQHEKKQRRIFIPDNEATRKTNTSIRYQIYPKYFSFAPKEWGVGDEPTRRDDLYIDLDCDTDQQRTMDEARRIIIHMDEVYDVPLEAWYAWLSGGKGVHLRLSAKWLGLELGHPHLPEYYKAIVMEDLITPLCLTTVDASIYNMKSGKPFRRENIQRENGKYKVPITLDELMYKTFENLAPLCDDVRKIIHEPEDGVGNRELLEKVRYRMKMVDDSHNVAKAEKRSPSRIQNLLTSKETPGCIAHIIADTSESEAGIRDFNMIAQTLTRYCHMKEMTLDESIELCREFIEGYQYSGSLKTASDRLSNFKARWSSMKSGYTFSCGYVRALKIDGVRTHCGVCAVECMSVTDVRAGIDRLAAEGQITTDVTDPWCHYINDANLNPMAQTEALGFVSKCLGGKVNMRDIKSVYKDYVDRQKDLKVKQQKDREEENEANNPTSTIYDPNRLGDMLVLTEDAINRGDSKGDGRRECFRFGDVVSWVDESQPSKAHAIDDVTASPPAVPIIKPHSLLTLRLRLEGTFQFCGGNMLHTKPPSDVLAGILDNPYSKFPKVSGLLTAPVVRHDGSYLFERGVDDVTGLYLHRAWPHKDLIRAEGMTSHTASKLYRHVADTLFGETEFTDGKGGLNEAVAMAQMLTTIQRKMMDYSPAFNITANIQGTGKTTLARMIYVVATGQDMPVYTLPNDNDEARKQMLSILIESPSSVCYDNLDDGAVLKSPVMSKVLTSMEFADRILGGSRMAKVPTNTTFCITGNNIRVNQDLLRRFLECKLTSSEPKPEQRSFTNSDVVGYVRSVREDIITSSIGLVAGYIKRGDEASGTMSQVPRYRVPDKGTGFSIWDKMVRFPILWATGIDLLRVFDRGSDESDERMAYTLLICELREKFKGDEFEAKDVVGNINSSSLGTLGCDLARALDGCDSTIKHTSPRSIGILLSKIESRITPEGTLKKRRVNNAYRYHVEDNPERKFMI